MSDKGPIRKLLFWGEIPSRDDPNYMKKYMEVSRAVEKLPEEEIEKIEQELKHIKTRIYALIL